MSIEILYAYGFFFFKGFVHYCDDRDEEVLSRFFGQKYHRQTCIENFNSDQINVSDCCYDTQDREPVVVYNPEVIIDGNELIAIDSGLYTHTLITYVVSFELVYLRV